MNADQKITLRNLLYTQEIAALGTLHNDRPYVSMVPFAILPEAGSFVIHVSQLAAHTEDMLANPQVSLLMVGSRTPTTSALETPRVTIQGLARQCRETAPDYGIAKTAYLSRFPESAELFGFADFSLFLIAPASIRYVGGFAKATTLSSATLAEVLSEG